MTIQELLKDYPVEQVKKYVAYCNRMATEKKQDGTLKNAWFQRLTPEKLADLFKQVNAEGLAIDGEHITIGINGLSYDYIAYKNKMYLKYPESIIDVSLVFEGDEFKISKESGGIVYSHKIGSPFAQDEKNIIGGYCVIKNKRGAFMTLLGKSDIEKHRKVAKTDFIWKTWFKEMALKTVIKKACKQHFADIYQEIENQDNDNYNLDNPVDLELKWKQEIDQIKTVEDLREYYKKNKGKGKDFDKYIAIRNQQIHNENI